MAKQQQVKCPFCGAKTTDDNGVYASHAEGDNKSSQCVMTGRPVEGRKHDGPVTDSSPATSQ